MKPAKVMTPSKRPTEQACETAAEAKADLKRNGNAQATHFAVQVAAQVIWVMRKQEAVRWLSFFSGPIKWVTVLLFFLIFFTLVRRWLTLASTRE